MLAIIVAVASGYFFFTLFDNVVAGLVTGVAGYILFLVFAYVRSKFIAADPVQRLAIAATGKPRGKEREVFLSSIIIPPVGAALTSFLF